MADFDPARVAELHANETLILDALDDAYQQGRLEYLHFSPAWDATAARMAALSWHLPRDSDVSEAEDGTCRLSGEAVAARACETGIAKPPSETPNE